MEHFDFIRNRALLKELIQWEPKGNYDRVLSLCQLMLYREEKNILYQGETSKKEADLSDFEKDDYWSKNYPKQYN